MGFLPGGVPDTGPDVSQVTTPDQKALGKSHGQGLKDSNIVGQFFAVLFSSLIDGLEIIIRELVGLYDEVLSLFVGLVTAAQGTQTRGFYDLTAQIINDLLGVEVAGGDLAAAGASRGLIGAMQKAGQDFFNVLLNEFLGNAPSASAGASGLPGAPGEPLSPDQGLKGAAAFLGFILSFAVRQGNLEMISTAIPESFRMFDGIRAYGELMGKNLGLGRLSRRVLQPIIQETIIGPLQQKLNLQYRPKVLDPKQIAGAFIRQDIAQVDYQDRLKLAGYTDTDIALIVADSFTRVSVADVYLLFSTGEIDETDFQQRMQALGYAADDVPIVRQARDLAAVQAADRVYAAQITREFIAGEITQADFEDAVSQLRIPKIEADALTRNAVNAKTIRHKQLGLAFLKKAYLNASITLDEYLAHAKLLGYSQDDVDILEQELLVEQKAAADKIKAAADKAKAKAAAAAAKAAQKAPTTPPATTPPASG